MEMKKTMVKFEKDGFLYQHDIRVLIIFRKKNHQGQKMTSFHLAPSQPSSSSTSKLSKMNMKIY